jgi:hypothetical protein
MATLDEAVAQAHAEANDVFGKLAKAVDAAAKRGGAIKVLDIAKQAGLEVDEHTLTELQLPATVQVLPFLPWYVWYPWRPFWCFWWRRRFYGYDSYPYWWNSCCPRSCHC